VEAVHHDGVRDEALRDVTPHRTRPNDAIRQADVTDAPGIARVQVTTWRHTYAGIVDAAYLEGMSVAQSEQRWRRRIGEPPDPRYAMFVVQGGDGDIVGFADCGPVRVDEGEAPAEYDGELYTIYVLPPHQRFGLGRRLFERAARHLYETGFRSMLLWAIAANPARRFYDARGGRVVREGEFFLQGQRIAEVGYGWTDLGSIVGAGGD
jgi:GNAT superfamily N-acetyltransferase